MKRIALKIDVDTYHGTQTGVPALAEMLRNAGAQATFFFSLGPDRSGRASGPESLKRHYDLSTRLYGRLLPAPDIGTRCADILRQTHQSGFEAGIHAWDRTLWEEEILEAGGDFAESAMEKAGKRFATLFGTAPEAHAAAGWRMNRHALRLTQRKGFSYASDCRGNHPFLPVIDGELIDCPQIPTTLPTLDEILVLDPGITPEQAVDRIFQLSTAIPGDHVFTLRAELEGIRFTAAFERLLGQWKNSGHIPVALRDIRASLKVEDLPRHSVEFSPLPGRAGNRMVQGQAFP